MNLDVVGETGPGAGECVILSCRWSTSENMPYFANLKVMRGALGAVRGEVEGCGGVLGAYLFFDHEFRFLSRGPLPTDGRVPRAQDAQERPLPTDGRVPRAQDAQERPEGQLLAALLRGRNLSAAKFWASDCKELWGPAEQDVLPASGCHALVDELLWAPVKAGLAPAPGDYPWCGGPWLLARV